MEGEKEGKMKVGIFDDGEIVVGVVMGVLEVVVVVIVVVVVVVVVVGKGVKFLKNRWDC